ncbi:MAG TPA: isoprenylcysteine carboxylmethyltransferase family protein [Terriglobales bacterium]|nr:isoprenylcysteine carboxylmethyltransferase family protein [Terriglobales bacterium]
MVSWPRVARRIRVPVGFVFAVVYLWLAEPTLVSLSAGFALIVVGLLIRALASGHVQKNEQLTTSGPYAYTRNPLYLGSSILAMGFALAARSWWIAAGMVVIFAAIYWPVIKSEEEFLRVKFSAYEDYARNVPRLFPRLTPFAKSAGEFSWTLYCKHREYNAFLGSLAVLAVLAIKMMMKRH